jgi:hypothetical protein
MAAQHVATEADLAGLANPQEGDQEITDDTGHLWKYTGGAWADQGQAPSVEPQAAPAPGTAVAGTTTIDALFTTMFATRSSDLGTPTYRWSDANTVQAIFASGTTPTAVNGSMMTCRFEARAFAPSSILP